MNDEAVKRTAPATPGLLITGLKCGCQCVTNTILMSEYEYEYIVVDFLWRIRIRIYLDPIS